MSEDFEEEIYASHIRKPAGDMAEQERIKFSKNKRYPVVPLLLRDVITAESCPNKLFTVFNGTVQLQACIVYARIQKLNKTNSEFKSYIIDDGSENMELYIYEKKQEMLTVNQLHTQLKSCEDNEHTQILLRILGTTKKFLDTSNIEPGTKALIIGRPSVYQGIINMWCDSIYKDETINRDMEIAFKTYLINQYMEQRSNMPANRLRKL